MAFVKIVETVMQGFDVIVDATGTYGNYNYSGQFYMKVSFSNLKIYIQDPEGCQLLVRGNLEGVET